LGAVSANVTPGAAPGLAPTATPTTVAIGNATATVAYAGLAPTFPGLYQVNVQVPPGIAVGDGIPVVMTVAGQSSPSVSISIR